MTAVHAADRAQLAWKESARALSAAVEAGEVPGAALAAAHGTRTLRVALGLADHRRGVPMTEDTVMHLGSVTKVLAATLVLRLAERRELRLDDPVAERIGPVFADPRAPAISARHLLSHSSGLPSDAQAPRLDVRAPDPQAYLASAAGVRLVSGPGTAFHYSSLGWVLLGRLAEIVTSRPWAEAVRDEVLVPGRLHHTSVDADGLGARKRSAGHVSSGGAWTTIPSRPYPRSIAPSGAAAASASDLVALGRLHLRSELCAAPRLLADATLERMQRPAIALPPTPGGATAWGLGWALERWEGRLVLSHGGAVFGQCTLLKVAPEEGAVIAVQANSSAAEPLCEAVARGHLGAILDVEPPAFAGYQLS